MNLSTWSIRNPVPSLLLFMLLTLLGLIGFDRLGIQQFPDMDLPTITISASLEGAAPAQLETEVARKIEDKLASLSRIEHITTTITDGAVSISVTFDIDKNGEEALNEVRNAVDGAKADLPASMTTPSVSKVTAETRALLTYSVRSDRLDETDLSWFIDNDVTKAVLSAKGVAGVTRIGGIDREVHVDLDPALMAGLGVTPSDVSTALKSVQADNSGGQGEIGGKRQSLRTLGAVGTVEEVAAIAVPLSDGRHVRLDQVARVSDAHADRSTRAFLDGQPVIAFQVTRSKGFSDAGVAEAARKAVSSFAAAHPEVTITEASTTVTPILENYRGSMHLLLEGAALAVVVVWWFLRDWRATLISAVALPLSILPAFAAMHLLGFSLNTVSLLALALVVGILVDDAIVEVENIARHMRQGKSARDAAMEAADEIGLAVIATTFTLVAVFLPTAFMGGIPGRIFRQFGVTAAVAVLASLLVARLLTPMMAAQFMKAHPAEERDGRLMLTYLATVRACLRHPWRTAFAAVAFLALSLTIVPLLPTGFMPAQDDAQSQVTLTLPPDAALDDTTSLALQAEALLRGMPEVTGVFTAVGTATMGGGMDATTTTSPRTASLTVELAPRSERHRSQAAVEAEMRTLLRRLPGTRVEVGRGNNGEQLQITLASDDPSALQQAADAVEADLRRLTGIGNVTSGAALQRPEIQIRPDFARAAALGVTSQDMADAVRMATYGDYSSSIAKLNLPQRQIAVRVRLDPAVRTDLSALDQLRVKGANGTVALASVAGIGFGSGPSQIDRIDRSRNVTLSVELAGRALGEVMREAKALPSMKALPASVHLVEQGELERMSELFGSFGTAMAVGVFCIYSVLVLLFHEFLQPATILAALPLSVGGALFALLVAGMSFSMPTVIGLLMLMGIVTKNSILLVEYAVMARRDNGLGRVDALIGACHKRARPILMTTIAMGAGMMPIALGLGADPSFRQPMAVVVIGGLLTSTMLSLLVIPALFLLVDDLSRWMAGWFAPRGATTTT
ncbi:multidrug efflux pump subunit AcrB [Azospirillum lipoferum]|uniref:Efflux RND transporter permease subunit n=1 Tax=Azospirillum lipoferum TaxID=193 RepID=A0A5A9GNS8_AZOLI|nr:MULTISPECIES: efflux RND transporter permease subunit [Azospirillum]KAA0596047.1 efflux RND transporter permease subunit [Azospirillum lipoferum]MCP1610975.1 multidrug efflux pump subunit AcrB [Azospirillum lipoferum]MDW5533892.1 efflux RND transporter permease subunit [Azospirillum sp. NL1]